MFLCCLPLVKFLFFLVGFLVCVCKFLLGQLFFPFRVLGTRTRSVLLWCFAHPSILRVCPSLGLVAFLVSGRQFISLCFVVSWLCCLFSSLFNCRLVPISLRAYCASEHLM
ncbi:hypothetical protein C8R45DRAFT_959868 [Mycena sanguinolenta]|nr:hypothetical protein C8R45DRAFT_959868 [Mycena sanguinolenta]